MPYVAGSMQALEDHSWCFGITLPCVDQSGLRSGRHGASASPLEKKKQNDDAEPDGHMEATEEDGHA
jgi:hypothetical protein